MSRTRLLDADRSAVVVIDLQGKFVELIWRPDLVLAATRRLMELAAIFARPVVLTEQYPKGLGATHPDVRSVYDEIETEKRCVEKVSFGCCGDDGVNRARDEGLPGVPVEAHVCVMQTVVELLRAGSEVHVCWECVSGRGEEYRRHALDRMQQAGAVITNHESVAFEWARTKDHEAFRAVNRLLREGQLEG